MLIHGIREGGGSKIYLYYPAVRELPLSLFASEVTYLVRDGCLLFYWRLMLRWVMGAWFENTYGVFGKLNVSWIVLYGWVYKILRLVNIRAEDSVVLVTAGYLSIASQFYFREWLVFNSRFTKFVLESNWSIAFLILVEDTSTRNQSSITDMWNSYLLCNSRMLWT